MAYEDRKPLLTRIEDLRSKRTLVCFFNFDRASVPPLPGIATQFFADAKEALFRVLRDSSASTKGVDLCLYTRGGDTNSVWPIVSIIREFDPDFEVLVPFRCHSSGTLLALGAKRIILVPLSELSPIDPSTGNQFNPADPANPQARLAISVEDVQAFRNFALEALRQAKGGEDEVFAAFGTLLQRLVTEVHPLALGNVYRVDQQIKKLGAKLLGLHPVSDRDVETVVQALASRFHSHLHVISRQEARDVLGRDQVTFADPKLADALDALLRSYEDQFALRTTFYLNEFMGETGEKAVRFIGGVVESTARSYLFETRGKITQTSKFPPNVQVQLPAGQRLPIVPGLPREYNVAIGAQGWVHNSEPKGITV